MITQSVSDVHLELATQDGSELVRLTSCLAQLGTPVSAEGLVRISLILIREPLTAKNRLDNVNSLTRGNDDQPDFF